MFFIKKVLIIFGGNSPEHHISCMSCKSVMENIDKEKYDVKIVGIDYDNNWYEYCDDIKYLDIWKEKEIKRINNIINYLKGFDVVFPIIHGINGEDGRLQGMLELFNIKYVGCNMLLSASMMDKAFSKILFNSLGINQVPYVTIEGNYIIDEIISKIYFPMIVKPSNGGSSIGISKVNNKKELENAVEEAKKYDSKVIIEQYVKVRELEVAVLENNGDIIISRPGEIKSANEFYDYNAKYINKKSYTTIPSDLSSDIISELKMLSKKIFKELGLKKYSRIDYFYDEANNKIYINEVNTIPGFTEISMYPKLMNNIGISYKELISKLME